MCGTRTVHHQAASVATMAARLGRDLSAELETGLLTSEAWRDMVLACGTCRTPGACARWLAATERAAAPPEYCENSEALGAG